MNGKCAFNLKFKALLKEKNNQMEQVDNDFKYMHVALDNVITAMADNKNIDRDMVVNLKLAWSRSGYYYGEEGREFRKKFSTVWDKIPKKYGIKLNRTWV